MRREAHRSFLMWATLALSIFLAGTVRGENIDPGSDGSQYAYAENVGWLNAEPSGDGGPGVEVFDFELTGWMWGENIGWVSVSCSNTSSCGTVSYGVSNDGCGRLSGYAWAENVGWVNFSPTSGGVSIDPKTGDFSGEAWAENVGWVTFASTGANPYKVKTAWTRAVPVGSASLSVGKSGTDAALSWTAMVNATAYDVVRGDLGTLRSTGGDFASATQACEANDHGSTSVNVSGTPDPGDGYWFLVRGGNCGGAGSYNTGESSQAGLRDTEIASSGNDCAQ